MMGVYIKGIEMPKDEAVGLIICSSGNVYYDHLEFAGKAIPAVDAVEVVRCKDCRMMAYTTELMGKKRMFCRHFVWEVDEDFYCAMGARKAVVRDG